MAVHWCSCDSEQTGGKKKKKDRVGVLVVSNNSNTVFSSAASCRVGGTILRESHSGFRKDLSHDGYGNKPHQHTTTDHGNQA